MKKMAFLFLNLVLISESQSAICRWDGQGFNHQWNDPLNWVDDLLPLPGDDVVLDNSVVAGSYDVYFPSGDVSITVGSLTILPSLPAQIRVILPASNTSLTAFRATGPDDAVVIGDGAQIINESGAATSSTPFAVTAAGLFRINNGGRYIHRTARSATDNLVSRLSVAPGTETGVFEFDVTVASYIVSLSGRSFGTLVLNAATNAATVNYRGSGGNPLSIRGDLVLNHHVNFTLSLSSAVQIGGSLITDTASTFNVQSNEHDNTVSVAGHCIVRGLITETGTGHPLLELNGTAQQQVALNRALRQEVSLVINNPQGCVLTDTLWIPFHVRLVKGKMYSSSNTLLLFEAVAGYTRDEGFVEGPVAHYGPDDFVYPVGAGQIYAPFELLDANKPVNEVVTVEYKRSNPQTQVSSLVSTTGAQAIDHISTAEYWEVSPGVDVGSKVGIAVNAESFCTNLSATFVVQSAGGSWSATGSVVASGPLQSGNYETGNLRTVALSGQAKFFTAGTSQPLATNPLPVNLIGFDASYNNAGVINFRWTISEPASALAQFIISIIDDEGKETDIRSISGMAGARDFASKLEHVVKGLEHYRLRMIDKGEAVFYSNAITINAEVLKDVFQIYIYPNPAREHTQIKILSSDPGLIDLFIRNSAGVIVRRINMRTWFGNTLIPLSLKDLPSGIYFVTGINSAGASATVRFISR